MIGGTRNMFVCDGELLRRVLREGRVTRVIHLAAQAGVRYSLKNPLAAQDKVGGQRAQLVVAEGDGA